MEGCGNQCVLDVLTCRLQNTRHNMKKKETSQTLRKNTWRLHGITGRLRRCCKKDTSQTLRKNTWRLHGITCRLTRCCKVHFAGKYPYLHVYNIHCRKKKIPFASATQKTCNIVHATHHVFFTEWILLLTRCLLRNDARTWRWMCTLRVFVPFTQ